ncbi:DUF1330 domain-containing protein [Phytopseudomonas dryadis]|uniref:DUF1330 domain-containing protein n=1 Tax=Phytopseudomonas dryadis TaxID=2487520 RepID=A0A4Q9R4C8_9GAMM|nr:DUF1330 domain-containing protein [Pseudomonas dryadis]TBU94636.1 DUF1330 domain-containing protein [Pseudomonas dryadis]
MTAYVVFVRETVTDDKALDRYRERAPAARNAHPLVPLAFYGAAARAWYASPEYQAALPHRLQGSTGRMVLVEGADAQPESNE